MPAPQAIYFVAADFCIKIAHGNEARQRRDLVLRSEHHPCRADRIHEAEFLDFRKSLCELEFSIAIDAWMRNGFVEGDLGRPLRDGVIAFGTLVETNLRGQCFIAKISGSFDEKIRKTGSGARIDDRGAIFLF